MNYDIEVCDGCKKAKEIVNYDGLLGHFCRMCTNKIEKAEKTCVKNIRQQTKRRLRQ